LFTGKSHALENAESWATFDPPAPIPAAGVNKKKQHMKTSRDRINKETLDSPCSSDGKDEWKTSDRGFNKKWPTRGHGSSSSRDVSPWDEEDPEYRRRPRPVVGPPPAPTSGSRYDHPRSIRRLNSGDDDYGYEEEIYDRRGRRIIKEPMIGRSRENFDAGKLFF
jgi:disabled homolog 2